MILGKSLDELGELPATELTEWEAFDHLHGLWDRRLEGQLALLTSVTANVFGGKTKAEDFMLGLSEASTKPPPKPETQAPDPSDRSPALHRSMAPKHANVVKFETMWAAKTEKEQGL